MYLKISEQNFMIVRYTRIYAFTKLKTVDLLTIVIASENQWPWRHLSLSKISGLQ